MPFADKDYHFRRAREHRALAEIASDEKAKLAHSTMADQHAIELAHCIFGQLAFHTGSSDRIIDESDGL